MKKADVAAKKMSATKGAGMTDLQSIDSVINDALSARGSSLLEESVLRSVLGAARKQGLVVGALEVYEITEKYDIPVIEHGLYGDEIAERTSVNQSTAMPDATFVLAYEVVDRVSRLPGIFKYCLYLERPEA